MMRRVAKPTLYERGCHRPIYPGDGMLIEFASVVQALPQALCFWPMPDEEICSRR
jgi:hypothetical protein